MVIAFFSNFLNHHLKLVADELYRTQGIDFIFVETTPMYDWMKNSGYTDFSKEKYVLRAWESYEAKTHAIELAKTSDVALFGGPEVLEYEITRARITNKLSFNVSERWLKKGFINIFSPRLLKYLWYYFTLFRKKPCYKLCASAYAAEDQYNLLTFKNRCYKWGYFTRVDHIDIDANKDLSYAANDKCYLMWCSRFLKWKHPEIPVKLAVRLKAKGYNFIIDMFGSGKELSSIQELTQKSGVNDVIRFCGNMPNDELLEQMRKHDVFLFTSDRNEGWGAVLNEAMANGCAAVGSDKIGAVPFLIKDGVNGCIFQSQNIDSLQNKVEYLLNNPLERKRLAYNAYITIKNIWSPENAAQSLLILIRDLMNGTDTSLLDGPCSKALPL